MAPIASKYWPHHVIVPAGIAALFGIVAFLQARSLMQELPLYLARPLIVITIIWLVMIPATALVNNALAIRHFPLIARMCIASLLGAIPLSFLIPKTITFMGGDTGIDDVILMPIAAYDDFLIQRYLKITMVIALLWNLANYRWYKAQELILDSNNEQSFESLDPISTSELENQDQSLASEPPAFTQRMTKPIGRDVLAIKAEQHYIRVYTAIGEELVLYRFGDALRELENFDGMQVHRSFWITKSAIQDISTSGSGYIITLQNDLKVPVSRSFKTQIDQAGWVQK